MATTVIGILIDTGENLKTHTLLKFKPLSGPTVIDGKVCVPEIRQTKSGADGAFTIDLIPGDYEVWAGGVKQYIIAVEESEADVNIIDIITTNLVYTGSGVPSLANKVSKTGDTMTGFLVLHANATDAMHPVTKQQMDAAIAGVAAPDLTPYVPKTGATLEGYLVLHADATDAMHPVTKQQLDAAALGGGDAVAGRQTIWVPASAMMPRASNGCGIGLGETTTNKINYPVLDFDPATSEAAQFQVAFPKAWDRGVVQAEYIWTTTGSSGGVVWAIAAVAISDDDALEAALGTAVNVTDTVIAAGDLHRSAETADITIAGAPAIGDWVAFQVSRLPADAADTLSVDARLIGIRLFYDVTAGNDD